MNIKVAISGKMGSGKTTFAKALQKEFSDPTHWYDSGSYTPKILGFAAPIHELLSLANINKSDPEFRLAAQTLGMTMRHVDPNFWINAFYNQAPASVIIDDLRFKNEFEWCKRHGFYLIRLYPVHETLQSWAQDDSLTGHISETDLDEEDGWDFATFSSKQTDFEKLAKILAKQIRERFRDSGVYRRGIAETVSTREETQ